MTSRDEATVGLVELGHGVRRMTAPNPSPLTAEGTHSFVLGRGEVVVVDPGPAQNGGHIDRLIAALGNERVVGIALTHRHFDHTGAVAELAIETGAEVLPSKRLADLGIESIAAPGHTSDHVVFRYGTALLTGDHVFEETSTLIDWPDGNLSAFLETTRRLRGMADLEFHPAHGPRLSHPAGRLDWLIEHREGRNAAIIEAVSRRSLNFNEIFDLCYADIPRGLREAAFQNLSAHLNHLVAEGRITSQGRDRHAKFLLASQV
jgi:glyoxylase-like metal-dependent hydrolase (beta-lactamase superfamily II)